MTDKPFIQGDKYFVDMVSGETYLIGSPEYQMYKMTNVLSRLLDCMVRIEHIIEKRDK